MTNVALAVKGDRIEKGTEIELTLEEAANFDPADITPVEAVVAEPKEEEVQVSIEEMTLDQLKAKAASLGLSTSGTKADLRERIELHLAGNADQSDEDGQGHDENADDQSDEDGQGEITSD